MRPPSHTNEIITAGVCPGQDFISHKPPLPLPFSTWILNKSHNTIFSFSCRGHVVVLLVWTSWDLISAALCRAACFCICNVGDYKDDLSLTVIWKHYRTLGGFCSHFHLLKFFGPFHRLLIRPMLHGVQIFLFHLDGASILCQKRLSDGWIASENSSLITLL